MQFKIYAAILFVCIFSVGSYAQTGDIEGTIRLQNGLPLPYATITIPQLKKQAVANDAGEFTFKNIEPQSLTLVITHTGVHKQVQTILVENNKTTVADITLTHAFTSLEEVRVNSKSITHNSAVTIGKVSINPMDLPQSISIINHQLLSNQQAQRLSDVIKNANGVYLSSNRASTQETFSARGYTFGSYNLFKNGTRVNSGAMPEVSSLESVEILKGSAAILYGNVAPGGIVNMVTKQPKFSKGGEVSMRAGSYSLYKPAFDVYAPISKTIAYRVNGTYEYANSYRNSVHSSRYYVNPSLLFTPERTVGSVGAIRLSAP